MKNIQQFNKKFTLIELILVIVIMGMLFGLALPAFSKMAIGSGVEAGLRVFSAHLSEAKQVALTEHTYVAIIIPDDSDLGVDNKNCFNAYRMCKVRREGENDFTFLEWFDDSSWSFVPNGSYIKITKGDCYVKVSSLTDRSGSTLRPLETIDPDNNTRSEVRAIILQPNGLPLILSAGNAPEIKIGEGYWDVVDPETMADKKGNKNFFSITLNQYSGRPEIKAGE